MGAGDITIMEEEVGALQMQQLHMPSRRKSLQIAANQWVI